MNKIITLFKLLYKDKTPQPGWVRNEKGGGGGRSMSYGVIVHHPSPPPSPPVLISGGGGEKIDLKNGKLEVGVLTPYKWRLLISYVGSRYSGWQYQATPQTIQCRLETALTQITKLERKDLCVVGASRTDKGVHAWGQVAQFVTPFNYDCLQNIHSGLNGLLPSDIRIRELSPAIPEFHARFSVTSKIYHYKIYNNAVMDPFQCSYAYHSVYKLNVDAMREAAQYFVGIQDFTSFMNMQKNEHNRNPVKDIFRVDIIEMGPLLQVEVEGSGFLYRQIRNMVALLLQVGREAVPPDIVRTILATRDRKELAKVALAAPPHGLCLMDIKYNEDHLQLPKGSPPTSFGRYHSINKCRLHYY